MPTADDPGAVAVRVDYPVGGGRIFAYAFFPVLAAPILVFLIQALRSPTSAGPAVFAGLLALVVGCFLLTLRLLNRRPTALEVREKGVVLHFGSRTEVLEWPAVRGIEQLIVGLTPMQFVLFHGRPRVAIGTGDRAIAVSQEIVRRAGLRWIHEPFTARRVTPGSP